MDKEDMGCMYVCVCVCIDTHTHRYITEYYSAIKKKEILPFATTWTDLEGIILSEASQTKTNII